MSGMRGLVLNVIAGHDPRDSTSVDVPVPDYGHLISRERLDGVRLGIPAEYFAEGMDPGVEKAVVTAIAHLQALGAQVEEVSPHTDYAISIYYLILTAEASSNLARFDGIRFGLSEPPGGSDIIQRYLRTRGEGFGPEVKRRIMLGTFALSAGYYDAYYLRAQRVRTLLRQDFARAFEKVDALIAPVSPTPAFRLGEKVDDPLKMYSISTSSQPTQAASVRLRCPVALWEGYLSACRSLGPHWMKPESSRLVQPIRPRPIGTPTGRRARDNRLGDTNDER